MFKIKNKFLLLLLPLFIGAIFFISAAWAQAASLSLSPSSGTYTVGANFSVSLYVSSSDQAINAVTARISYPKDKLSVNSISKGSIINFWAEEPSFNNNTGLINLSGVSLNPGFTGKSGKIITISFKVKGEGKVNLSLPYAQVLANDGSGTDILKAAGGAQFTFNVAEKKEETDGNQYSK